MRLRGDGRRREQDTRPGNKKGDLMHVWDVTPVGNRHGKGEQGSNSMGGGQRIQLGDEATSIAAGLRVGREEGCRNGCRMVVVHRKMKI